MVNFQAERGQGKSKLFSLQQIDLQLAFQKEMPLFHLGCAIVLYIVSSKKNVLDF